LAHPTGITEIQEGAVSVDGDTLEMDLFAAGLGRSESAKEVVSVGRLITFQGDTLTYTVRMAAVGHPLQHHLSAVLHRTHA
ncbi:fatty acid-binding-like protein, partial [Mycobacterium sp. ITM-2017-0098]